MIIAVYDVIAHKDGQQANKETTILIISNTATIVALTNQVSQRLHWHFIIIIQKHLKI